MKKLAIMMLVLLGPATARAYDVPVEVGAFAGASFISPTSHLGFVASNPHSLADTGTVGFHFALNLIKHLALEAELGLSPTEAIGTGDGVLVFGYRGHAVVHILTGRVRPFVLAGGGGITVSSSNPPNVKEDTRGEIHGGVGLKVDIKCNWGARIDGRVQFEQSSVGSYITEDWQVFAGIYGLFGWSVNERCHKQPAMPAVAHP